MRPGILNVNGQLILFLYVIYTLHLLRIDAAAYL